MLQSQLAVLERGVVLEAELATEPFEVAWASEARWYVQFLKEAPSTRVALQVQISPDGLNWIDHETVGIEVVAAGFVSIPVTQFGHWLRIKAAIASGVDVPMLRINLALKG